MNGIIDSFAFWLADFYLLNTILLVAALVAMWFTKQPVKRLAVAKSVLVAIGLLAVLCALPGWSVIHLLAGRESVPPTIQSSTASSTISVDASAPVAPAVASEDRSVAPLSLSERPQETFSAWAAVSLTTLLGLVHLAGSACVLAWLGLGALAARRLVRSSWPAPIELSRLLADIALPTGRGFDLLVWDRIDVAVAIGVTRPSIVLPNRWVDDRSAEELQVVLAHEVAHVRNGDLAWLAVSRGLLVIVWAQPLYWLLRRALRLDQEALADAAAAELSDRRQYAEQLVAWARGMSSRPRLSLPAAVGLWEGPSQLRRRIALLLDERLHLLRDCSRRWRAAAGLMLAAAAISLSLVTLQPASQAADESQPAGEAGAQQASLEYSGTVVNKRTDTPVAQATVRVKCMDTTNVQPWKTLEETIYQTDSAGRFQFDVPSALLGDALIYFDFEISHPDFAPLTVRANGKTVEQQVNALGDRPSFERIALEPGEIVTGIVQKPDGSPAGHTRVMAFSMADPQNYDKYSEFGHFETDAVGKFRVTVVAGGSAVIWLLPKDFAAQTHVIDRRRGDLGVFQLEKGVRLSGRVVDQQGSPLPNLWVNARLVDGPAKKEINLVCADQIERSALTDADGRFQLGPLPPSTYRVVPDLFPEEGDPIFETPHPVSTAFLPYRVKLFSSESAPSIELRAVEPSTVSAQFVDSEGQPTYGYAFFLNGTTPEGQRYSIRRFPDPSGKVTCVVPKNLTNAYIDLPLSSIRQRKVAGALLSKNNSIYLGNLDRDWHDIQITMYEAPVLLIDVSGPDGKRLSLVKVVGEYTSVEQEDNSYVVPKQEIDFEQQADGKWRSDHDLVPDEEFRVRIAAEGFQPVVETMSLKEGVIKELAVTLTKSGDADTE
jgi:beta-lactamase regulating signal transducer with metallopeptidase domain